MNFLSLVLCVGILHITTASRGLPQPHHLHKRRGESGDNSCAVALIAETCSSGYDQGRANVELECNQSAAAENIQRSCQSSSSGTICGGVDTSTLFQTVNATCGSSPTTCSSDCQDLLNTTRAELGCCLTYITMIDRGIATALSNSLWSLCEVELVTEECAQGPIQLPETDIDPTCGDPERQERLYNEVFCRTQYLDSLQDAFQLCDLEAPCAVNEEGQYCFIATDLNAELNAASTNCNDTSTCDPLCTEVLDNITSCCFISIYNMTSRYDWLSYEFWSQCGLTSPGFCESRFNDDPVNGSGTTDGIGATDTTGNTSGTTDGIGATDGDGTTGNIGGTENSVGENAAAILKAPGIAVTLAITSMVLTGHPLTMLELY